LNETHIHNVIYLLFLSITIISCIIFYLDNFKLSSSRPIKYFQVLSFICMLFINYARYSNNARLHGEYNVTKESAEIIGKGMNSIGQGMGIMGTQLGLGATMVGVSTAVGKGLAKSAKPPLQKAGVIIGGAMLGGITHSVITTYNRSKVHSFNTSNLVITNNTSDISNSNISKFMDDSLFSPLQALLFNIEALNITCLSLTLILIIQIIFKLHLKNSIKLNLSTTLGTNLNNNLEYYINKIITLNKKMSIVYIWLILILIIYALSLSIYVSDDLYSNIDKYISEHINYKK
jgi:hypothetical protein